QHRVLPMAPVNMTIGGNWIANGGGCSAAALQIPERLPIPVCWSALDLSGPQLHLSMTSPSVDPARPAPTIMPGAIVAPDVGSLGRFALISPGASIGSGAVIGPNAVIGPGAVVGPGALVGAGAHVGGSAVIEAGATVEGGCTIDGGARVGANAVL